MACPYFVPRQILNDGSWPHPSRLPLGAGWTGECCASGSLFSPHDFQIHEFCNLGYAKDCPRLPADRDWDAIRFAVAKMSNEQIVVGYSCELDHAPVAHGKLVFDSRAERWADFECDARVRGLADAFLQSYRAKSEAKSQLEEVET